jgi:hypothetical protein
MDVVIQSLEIQDAEPIHATLMSEAAATSRGGIELLADDLVPSGGGPQLGVDAPGRAVDEGTR